MRSAASHGFSALARGYLQQFPEEAARQIETAPVGELVPLFSREAAVRAIPVFDRLASNVAADLLQALPPDTARRIVAGMDPVRAASVLGWLDEPARSTLLESLEPAQARDLRAMAEYPPDTAGRLMDPRVLAFREKATAGEALARLRAVRGRAVADVFLTAEDGQLVGRVGLDDLAVAPPGETLGALSTAPASIAATAAAADVVALLTDRRLTSLPVVDFEGRLLGVIRHDTLVTTAQQDVAADIQAMVGASREERALSRVSFAVRKRLPWLEINLLTAFLAAGVVGLFEATITKFTALAVLLPVVAGQSGNTGAQALAVTMRGLALREIRVAQWPRVARKELTVAFLNGVAIAVTTSVCVLYWSGSPGLAFVIGSAMVLSMIAAGVAGVIIPMMLTSFGQDPAQSSSIVLTTVTDVVGFASFLGIATALSGVL
ncbi:MAG TPA: magnesium transporter [Vicinamibacterales bacterium]|nr:magnesium transporter [Vicinamibacterales bacterium]